jgi:ABC-type lipoprotein export system ATPase subunit
MSDGARNRMLLTESILSVMWSVARALIFEPDIIFLDEPIGNLDSKAGTDIMELFKKINQEYGKTLIQVV